MTYELALGWPQGIYLAMTLIGVLYINHKEGPEDALKTLLSWVVLIAPLLYWGGFFTHAVTP